MAALRYENHGRHTGSDLSGFEGSGGSRRQLGKKTHTPWRRTCTSREFPQAVEQTSQIARNPFQTAWHYAYLQCHHRRHPLSSLTLTFGSPSLLNVTSTTRSRSVGTTPPVRIQKSSFVIFRNLSREKIQPTNTWTDSYLIAFAEASSLSLVTFDKALATRAPTSLLLRA
jgi:hypothetical protein